MLNGCGTPYGTTFPTVVVVLQGTTTRRRPVPPDVLSVSVSTRTITFGFNIPGSLTQIDGLQSSDVNLVSLIVSLLVGFCEVLNSPNYHVQQGSPFYPPNGCSYSKLMY